MKFKELYDILKESGDLFEVYENMTGDYNIDRKSFREQHKGLESLGNNIEVYE